MEQKSYCCLPKLSLIFIFFTSITIFKSTYKYLSDKATKIRYKNLKIFGATIYYWILFVFTFNLPEIFTFSFETDSLITNKIETIPKNFKDGINFCMILFSGYITQRSTIKVLKRDKSIKTFFELLKSYRRIFFNKIFKLFKR